jgi:peptidoglycan hydrolase-like protein with peptidoglycan-binding domain
MSTQLYTPDDEATRQQDPRQPGRGPSRSRVWIAALGAALAGAVIALAVTLSGSHSAPAPATGNTPASTSSTSPANPATPVSPAHPSTPSGGTTPVKPSAAVTKLQQQLGQLNYYEGRDDGIMGPQTVAAIKDLQRDAHLPQTGAMNAATQAALANFLAHGNNQMNG